MRLIDSGVVRAAVLLIAVWSTVVWGAVGFGTIRKRAITLQTRQPATVRLSNTTIALKASAADGLDAAVGRSLLSTLETALVSNDKTLVVKANPAEAEWVLDLKVTGYTAPPPERSQSGKVSNLVWSGALNATYQLIDRGGRVLDADNLTEAYKREVNDGAASALKIPGLTSIGRPKNADPTTPRSSEDVKQAMIRDLTRKIAADLGVVTLPIQAPVPLGESHLEHAADLMEKQLWSRALEELETMSPFSNAQDEAYRTYDLGLVYEGIGYDSSSASELRTDFQKAAAYYIKAAEMNPKDKYLVEAVARTHDTLVRFKTLDSKKSVTAKAGGNPSSANPTATAALPPRKPKALGVADAVEMYAAGVPEDQIVDVIREAHVDFNPYDNTTAIAIARSRLPVSIQNELRKKVGAPSIASSGGRSSLATRIPLPVETAPKAPLQRFPTIEAPGQVARNLEFSVQVSLTMEKQTPQVNVVAAGSGTTITPDGGLQLQPCQGECVFEVVLYAPAFDIAGSNTQSIRMKAGAESTVARFQLKGRGDAPEGPARISATFWRDGAYLAKAVRTVQLQAPVTPKSQVERTAAPMAMAAVAPKAGVPNGHLSTLPVELTAPDLTIRWEESQVGNRVACLVTVSSPHLGATRSEACEPAPDLNAFVSLRYRRLRQLAYAVRAGGEGTADRKAQLSAEISEMQGFGTELYKRMPAVVREAFWKLVDLEQKRPGFRFRSIQVVTNNTGLPWELIVPTRDRTVFRGSLGMEFLIARWHIDDQVQDLPPLDLVLQNAIAIAPKYEGDAALKEQARDFVEMKKLPGYRESGGKVKDVAALLDHSSQGIVHFAGHGIAESGDSSLVRYRIQLEDAAMDPTAWRAHMTGADGPFPLYFFNACETGKEAKAAGFLDGWAAAILDTGASGFIGGLWPLADAAAASFSAAFYGDLRERLGKGEPAVVAELVKNARHQFLTTGDPTFLGYVFYGDTRLRILMPAKP